MAYSTVQQVRIEDTTQAGTMFYVSVLRYLNRAVEDVLSTVGYGYAENLEARDLALFVVHVDIDYVAPVSLGTDIDIAVTPTVDDSTITFDATGRVDGEEVFRATEVRVAASLSETESRAVPAALADGLAAYAD